MEYVGRIVEKEFKGYGVYSGIVQSYDASSGFFEIVYDDGDTEELDFSEVVSLLGRKHAEPAADPRPRLGRRPKKRRRGNYSVPFTQSIAETLVEANGKFDMNRNVNLNDGFIGDLRDNEGANGNMGNVKTVDLNETVEREGIDLNAGFNLNLNEGFDLNEEDHVNPEILGNLKKRECIDLNLDVNENLGEFDLGNDHMDNLKRECGFDLNLGIDEEMKDDEDGECRVQAKGRTSNDVAREETPMNVSRAIDGNYSESVISNDGTLPEVYVSNNSCLLLDKGFPNKDTVSGEELRAVDSFEAHEANIIKEDSPEVIEQNQGDMRSAYEEGIGVVRRGRGRRRKNVAERVNLTPETFIDAKVIYGNQGDVRSAHQEGNGRQRRQRRGKLVDTLNSSPIMVTTVIADPSVIKEDSAMVTYGKQNDIGSAYKEVTGSCRKRRKLSDNANAIPEMTVLRRSTRRGSAKNEIPITTPLIVLNDLSGSPAVSALTEEKHVNSCLEWPKKSMVLPAKVQLPPSSQNLDLDGISVIDFFSVYSCLRSFSVLLFLSPFELEEFAASLKCSSPSSLFDCIHLSILQILRKHLEYLSNEGSESASNCLRSLNWDLLDLVTWPIFMVEFLLIHGSDLKPGLNLCHFKLLKINYHKLPVSVKVEILRYLCDSLIEVEDIRSELNRRSTGSEFDLDLERNASLGVFKKRRAGMDVSGGSCLTDEIVDDTTDWNSDECCLCKMDGSLICCDGCPAAYHSKCVGVANDSLPEGDWFCPECAIDRHKPWMKFRKSVRGADLLGVDPYGRLYFSSCGYLLVSYSSETESSFNYYHRDDLNAVVRVLRSSEMVYSSILEAIQRHWDIPVTLYGASSNLDSLNLCSDMCMAPTVLASSETYTIKSETADQRKAVKKFVIGCSGNIDVEIPKQTCLSSEGSAETIQTSLENQNFQKEVPDCSNRSAEIMNESDMPEKCSRTGDNSLTLTHVDLKTENVIGSAGNGQSSSVLNAAKGNTSEVQLGTGYFNYYSFGHIASSIAEELLQKSSEKAVVDSTKSEEEIILAQMKIISKNSVKFHWPNIPRLNVDVQKEKCGWCFYCRASSDDLGCLFNMSLGPVREGSVNKVVGLELKRNKNGHLSDIIGHILLIEDRLQGLLLGPWLNPHYSRLWRKSVLKASDILSVKRLLLMLESNLRHLALSAEWLKHVDSSTAMGSGSHIVIASSRASSKNGIGRKRARCSEFDSNPSSNSASGLGMLWWRGGRLSCQLFSWKVLPHSLVSKAARQAGRMKIPGMLYPENSDFAKRSKYIAWRAAVESSSTVEQLALQVRELDSNIRWDEIDSTNLLSTVDKESKKSIRLFKKVIVRRKCIEGEGAKYLLDFGKRRSIPEVVLKNGSMVEESSSERKKYWVNESYIPLYLLKSFEEKKIARRSSKMSSGKLSDASVVAKNSSKKRGFSYLFAKAERSDYHQCEHCNKDVPIRDAVCCQYCKGFFHKRHVRKSTGSITAKCMYACHRCLDGKYLKIDPETRTNDARKGKNNNKSTRLQHQKSKKASVGCRQVQLKNSKNALQSSRTLRSRKNKKVAVVVPLRRSPRKTKYNSLQNKKVKGRKKGKQVKSKKATYKKPTKGTSSRKKRTEAYHSYWINGLLLSRKPDDERVMHFRSKRFIAPSENIIHQQPNCHLCCEAVYASTLNYISCEICEEWFHGDAFGLTVENSKRLIGFRCHLCRSSTPPVCPHIAVTRSHGSEMAEAQNDIGNELFEELTNVVPHLDGTPESLANEDQHDSLLVDVSVHGKDELGTTLDPDLRSRLEMGNGQLLHNVKEITDAIQVSSEKDPEPILCNGNLISKQKTIESGLDVVTLRDQVQPLSCDVDVDVMETEQEPSEREGASNGLAAPIVDSTVDGNLLESIELHPHSCMASAEL